MNRYNISKINLIEIAGGLEQLLHTTHKLGITVESMTLTEPELIAVLEEIGDATHNHSLLWDRAKKIIRNDQPTKCPDLPVYSFTQRYLTPFEGLIPRPEASVIHPADVAGGHLAADETPAAQQEHPHLQILTPTEDSDKSDMFDKPDRPEKITIDLEETRKIESPLKRLSLPAPEPKILQSDDTTIASQPDRMSVAELGELIDSFGNSFNGARHKSIQTSLDRLNNMNIYSDIDSGDLDSLAVGAIDYRGSLWKSQRESQFDISLLRCLASLVVNDGISEGTITHVASFVSDIYKTEKKKYQNHIENVGKLTTNLSFMSNIAQVSGAISERMIDEIGHDIYSIMLQATNSYMATLNRSMDSFIADHGKVIGKFVDLAQNLVTSDMDDTNGHAANVCSIYYNFASIMFKFSLARSDPRLLDIAYEYCEYSQLLEDQKNKNLKLSPLLLDLARAQIMSNPDNPDYIGHFVDAQDLSLAAVPEDEKPACRLKQIEIIHSYFTDTKPGDSIDGRESKLLNRALHLEGLLHQEQNARGEKYSDEGKERIALYHSLGFTVNHYFELFPELSSTDSTLAKEDSLEEEASTIETQEFRHYVIRRIFEKMINLQYTKTRGCKLIDLHRWFESSLSGKVDDVLSALIREKFVNQGYRRREGSYSLPDGSIIAKAQQYLDGNTGVLKPVLDRLDSDKYKFKVTNRGKVI